MAAGISAVVYGRTFGFIGLYIAKPEFRSRGFGCAVWDDGMGPVVATSLAHLRFDVGRA